MKPVHALGLCALLATPAYGQYAPPQPAPTPEIDWSRGQYTPPASTNRIPILDTIPKTPITNTPTAVIRPASIVPRTSVPPATAPNAYSAAAENIDKVKKSAVGGVDTGKVLGMELDPITQRRMDRVVDGVGVVQHGLGAYGAYRAEGAEGMLVYGIQEGGEQVLDNIVERAFPTYAPAWRLGRLAGDLIKENVEINNQTIESHVTNLYFHVLEGRAADRAFELNTSDGAIELHRQRMRRAGIYSGVQSANEQAAANRAAIAAQASTANDNAAFMNDMMLTIMPAVISASQQRALQPAHAAASSEPFYCQRGMPRCDPRWGEAPLETDRRSWPVTPPLGSTFGTPRGPSGASPEVRQCTAPGCYERNTEQGPGCRGAC